MTIVTLTMGWIVIVDEGTDRGVLSREELLEQVRVVDHDEVLFVLMIDLGVRPQTGITTCHFYQGRDNGSLLDQSIVAVIIPLPVVVIFMVTEVA